MGGSVSACCSVEEPEERVILKEKSHGMQSVNGSRTLDAGAYNSDSDYRSIKKNEALEIKAMKERLQEGMQILVMLQDGTKLACTLNLDMSCHMLSISCEDKVRNISISEIKSLLSTKEQLRRVETKANLTDDQNCVALHLQETGNCIPLRFDRSSEKRAFVALIKDMKNF